MAEVASFLALKLVDLFCGVAKKEISHIWNCSENVENFKSEAEKLSCMKGRVQQQIDLAKSKGELLLEGVEEWVNKADAKLSDAAEFIAEEAEAQKTCFNVRLCVNLSTLRHYSKLAIKRTSFLLQHQGDGKDFESRVSVPAPNPGFVDLYQRKNLENIDTQKTTLKKIIQAIKDDKIQIVGINGLGGVGKTTLASEVAAKMKNEFADIVFIVVSQTIDTKMIQEKAGVAARRIINGQKVLIILDDVWEELKLEEVGIPCGSDYMNCKVLLTSRSRDVCEAMNVQKNISVNPLQEKEAWTLFERVVDKSEWDDTLKQVALKIVQQCGGLPLFIQVVGKALKNKDIKIWEAALHQLQAPTDGDAPFKRKGIMQLKLSYDYLEDEVAKSCFLLCSMFPEDGVIDLERLTYYGFGLGIFDNPDSIEDAKDRVQLAVETLKSSFLLLPVKMFSYNREGEEFKMHDLVRDMALFVTSKGNDKFLVKSGKGLREWQPRNETESYQKISLMENKIVKLHDHELLLPHLDTFLIQDNELSVVPNEFFRCMEQLKVLDMSLNDISYLPQSLKHLTKLCTLDLSGNTSLREISILGELTCLEILKIKRTGITNIPEEIGKLIKLRLLDIYSCYDLTYVAPGVISKLILLEELYVEFAKVGSYEFLVELSELKLLKVLHLTVPELQFIPQDSRFETLIEFNIRNNRFVYATHHYKRSLQFSSCSFPFTIQAMKLIQVCEMIELWGIKDLNNILPDLYQEGFDELKYIELRWCDSFRSLVKTCDLTSNELGQKKTKRKFFSKVKEIMLDSLNRLELLWDSPHEYISFYNLATIEIRKCPSLVELFPLGVAQGLVNLRKLDISYCESLVVVISAGDEQTGGSKTKLVKQDSDIMFPLTDIVLRNLLKLESFYSGHSTIKYSSLKSMIVEDCGSMKRWSNGDNHMPKLHFDSQGINDYIAVQHERNENFTILEKGMKTLDDFFEEFHGGSS